MNRLIQKAKEYDIQSMSRIAVLNPRLASSLFQNTANDELKILRRLGSTFAVRHKTWGALTNILLANGWNPIGVFQGAAKTGNARRLHYLITKHRALYIAIRDELFDWFGHSMTIGLTAIRMLYTHDILPDGWYNEYIEQLAEHCKKNDMHPDIPKAWTWVHLVAGIDCPRLPYD